jgi:tetratricopeptide (TPR) repeat protein
MLFGLVGLGLRRFSSEIDRAPAGFTLHRVPLACGIVVAALAFGYGVGRTGISDLIYERADADSDEKAPSETIAAANEALKFDPHNVPALILLGDMHRMLAAHDEDIDARVKEGELAADAYQRAMRDNPLDDTITASLGLTYDIMYRYPEAYFCYANALAHQPYDGQFWFRLGNHFWQVGMLEKAEQAYQMGMRCPHGAEENVEPEREIRPYLAAQGIPLPAPGTNPLKAAAEVVHPTVP